MEWIVTMMVRDGSEFSNSQVGNFFTTLVLSARLISVNSEALIFFFWAIVATEMHELLSWMKKEIDDAKCDNGFLL